MAKISSSAEGVETAPEVAHLVARFSGIGVLPDVPAFVVVLAG
jgi:hypothetical protein